MLITSYLKKTFFSYTHDSVKHIARLTGLILTFFLLLNGLFSPLMADTWDELQSHDLKIHEYDESLYEDNQYIWKEGKTKLPDMPAEKDLVAVQGSAEYQHYQYLIDVNNLRVDPDQVVRYTIVIRAPGGSQSVVFEGLRCSSEEYKTYAYGNANGFSINKSSAWKRLSSRSVMGYTKSLAQNYFCNNLGQVLKRHEIVNNIKYGKGMVDGLYIE